MLIPQPRLMLVLVVVVVVAGACLCVDGGPAHLPRRDSRTPLPTPPDWAVVAASSGSRASSTDPSEVDGSAGGGGGGRGGGGGDGGPEVRGAGHGEARGVSNGDVFSGGNSGPGGEVLRRERREAWAEGEAAESLSEPGDDRSRPTAYTALSLDSERGSPGVSVAEGNATTVVATPTSPDDRRAANEAVDAPGSALSGPHVSGDQTDPAPASPTGAAPQDDARDQRSAARERDPAPGWPSSQGPPGGPGQIPGPTPSVARGSALPSGGVGARRSDRPHRPGPPPG